MSDRTIGQKVNQWLTNIKLVIPLLSVLGIGTIYGNSSTVRNFIHSPEPVITKEIKIVNYDRIIKELTELNKKQDARINKQQLEINRLKKWHE